MMEQKAFCKKYGVTTEELEKSQPTWSELQEIASDHVNRTRELEIAARSVVSHLEKCAAVHSLRWRIKNPEHLVEKIIRKVRAEPDRRVSLDNYRTEITDLVGVRALHLFKSDWLTIHEQIDKTWGPVDGHNPIAYVREGDESKSYQEHGCKVEVHKRDYRSVHYVIQFSPTKEVTIAEIQVRTLFEEGWSEIDHRIAYPHNADDPILTGYLRIFNLLAGASDQMATYIGHLKREMDKMRTEAEIKDQEAKKAIMALEKMQKELGTEKKEKKELEGIVQSLKRSAGNNALTIGNIGNIFGSTSTASGNSIEFHPGVTTVVPIAGADIARHLNPSILFTSQQRCSGCNNVLPVRPTNQVIALCPNCGKPY